MFCEEGCMTQGLKLKRGLKFQFNQAKMKLTFGRQANSYYDKQKWGKIVCFFPVVLAHIPPHLLVEENMKTFFKVP